MTGTVAMIASKHRARPGSVHPPGARDMRRTAHTPSPARGKMALLAGIVAVLALAIGCGSDGDAAAVETELAAYLDREGIEAEVMDGGCSDDLFERGGNALWKCVVYVGNDAQTWNVAFDGEQVVDASQAR